MTTETSAELTAEYDEWLKEARARVGRAAIAADYARRMGENEADIPAVVRRLAESEPRPLNPPSTDEE